MKIKRRWWKKNQTVTLPWYNIVACNESGEWPRIKKKFIRESFVTRAKDKHCMKRPPYSESYPTQSCTCTNPHGTKMVKTEQWRYKIHGRQKMRHKIRSIEKHDRSYRDVAAACTHTHRSYTHGYWSAEQNNCNTGGSHSKVFRFFITPFDCYYKGAPGKT